MEHFNQVRIIKVKLKDGVTDPVEMDAEEEEDSLSRKLFERTESLLGRFNIKEDKYNIHYPLFWACST